MLKILESIVLFAIAGVVFLTFIHPGMHGISAVIVMGACALPAAAGFGILLAFFEERNSQ